MSESDRDPWKFGPPEDETERRLKEREFEIEAERERRQDEIRERRERSRPVPPDEFDPEDRYHMGHSWGGGTFGDRPVEDFRSGMIDEIGPLRNRGLPKSRRFLSSNMLDGSGKLRKIFQKFFNRTKRDVQAEIDKLRKELAGRDEG